MLYIFSVNYISRFPIHQIDMRCRPIDQVKGIGDVGGPVSLHEYSLDLRSGIAPTIIEGSVFKPDGCRMIEIEQRIEIVSNAL
jgi:hypothetical protein